MNQFANDKRLSKLNESRSDKKGIPSASVLETITFDLGRDGRFASIKQAEHIVTEIAKTHSVILEKNSDESKGILLYDGSTSYIMTLSNSSTSGPETQFYPTLASEDFSLSLLDSNGTPLMILNLKQTYGSNYDGSMDWRSDATGELLRLSNDPFVLKCFSELKELYRKTS